MKIFYNVRSTTEVVPEIYVDVDTVYVRENITRVTEEDREEWNIGVEKQYPLREFIELMSGENKELKIEILDLKSINRMNLLALMELDARIGGE